MVKAKLRLAEPTDSAALEEFLVFNNGERNRKLGQDYIRAMFSDDYRKPTFVIAEIDNAIIGAAAFSEEYFTTRTWGISWVSVHEDHRNQGIGQQLVEHCLTEITARAGKTVSVILATYPDKTQLYEKCGFKLIGQDYGGGNFMTKVVGTDA